jgi:hypothetical protein
LKPRRGESFLVNRKPLSTFGRETFMLQIVEPSIVNTAAMQLPTADRSIRDENKSALLRRWHFAHSEDANDISLCQAWFPGQRMLLDLLAVSSIEEAINLADTGLPLFTPRIPMSLADKVFQSFPPTSAMHAEAIEEVFMAMVSRLDALRASPTQGALLYDLQPNQARLIARHNPRELHTISTDPSMLMIPAVSDEYFLIAGTTDLSFKERTVLAGTSRKKRAL